MVLGIVLLVAGWLLINPGSRKHRAFAVLGTIIITAAMLTIVQARY
jgi:ammonia channel protein AmtB